MSEGTVHEVRKLSICIWFLTLSLTSTAYRIGGKECKTSNKLTGQKLKARAHLSPPWEFWTASPNYSKLKRDQHLISGSLLGKKWVRPGAIIPVSATVPSPYKKKKYHCHMEITQAWQKGTTGQKVRLGIFFSLCFYVSPFCYFWVLTSSSYERRDWN